MVFLPLDGVFEHNFVLQGRLGATRAGGGDLCMEFMDFPNASSFDSVHTTPSLMHSVEQVPERTFAPSLQISTGTTRPAS